MSIASIQSEIDEYQAKINKYSAILAKVGELPAYLEKCNKTQATLGGYLSFIVISGESIDQGAVAKADKNNTTISEYIATITEQGNSLIEKYTSLKEEACRRLAALLAEIEKSRKESNNNIYNNYNTPVEKPQKSTPGKMTNQLK